MSARAESMAAIDAALAAPTRISTANAPTVASPQVAPGVQAGAPLTEQPKPKGITADEKRAFDVARQERLDTEAAQEKALAAQQKEEDAFEQSAQSLVRSAKGIVRGGTVRLERIPTPGSIWFPLALLLLFFFLLIPVNGHTRFVWLWLTLTGNAHIEQGGDFQGDSGGNQPLDDNANVPNVEPAAGLTQQATGIPDLSIVGQLPGLFTGVEDIS